MSEEELKKVIQELQTKDFDLNWKLGNVIIAFDKRIKELENTVKELKKQIN